MDRLGIVREFNRPYLGDSLLQQVVLNTGAASCGLTFDGVRRLKAEGASIFDPEATFTPALLRFRGVRSIDRDGAAYQLNSTVIGFGAAPVGDGDLIEFHFVLTGGHDPEAFMVRLNISVVGFDFGPAL